MHSVDVNMQVNQQAGVGWWLVQKKPQKYSACSVAGMKTNAQNVDHIQYCYIPLKEQFVKYG